MANPAAALKLIHELMLRSTGVTSAHAIELAHAHALAKNEMKERMRPGNCVCLGQADPTTTFASGASLVLTGVLPSGWRFDHIDVVPSDIDNWALDDMKIGALDLNQGDVPMNLSSFLQTLTRSERIAGYVLRHSKNQIQLTATLISLVTGNTFKGFNFIGYDARQWCVQNMDTEPDEEFHAGFFERAPTVRQHVRAIQGLLGPEVQRQLGA